MLCMALQGYNCGALDSKLSNIHRKPHKFLGHSIRAHILLHYTAANGYTRKSYKMNLFQIKPILSNTIAFHRSWSQYSQLWAALHFIFIHSVEHRQQAHISTAYAALYRFTSTPIHTAHMGYQIPLGWIVGSPVMEVQPKATTATHLHSEYDQKKNPEAS